MIVVGTSYTYKIFELSTINTVGRLTGPTLVEINFHFRVRYPFRNGEFRTNV